MARPAHDCLVREVDRALRRFRNRVLAADGVFTRAMAREGNLTDRTIHSGLESGQWQRFRGVYRLSGVPESDRLILRAALLRAGPRAFGTGPSALSIYGLDTNQGNSHSTRIGGGTAYLSVPVNRHITLVDCVVLRDLRRESNAEWHWGFPLVSRHRAIVDALRVLEQEEALAVLFRSLQRRWCSPESLADSASRLAGHRGLRQLRAMAKEAASGAHAESERILHRILRDARIGGWEANRRLYDNDGLIGIVDLEFAEARLVVEVDGRAHHTDRDRFQNDRTRQNRLVLAGWAVLRFTWEDLIDRPHDVAIKVHAKLAECLGHR